MPGHCPSQGCSEMRSESEMNKDLDPAWAQEATSWEWAPGRGVERK